MLLVPSLSVQGLGSPYYQITPLAGYGGFFGADYLNNVGQVAGFFTPLKGDHEHNWTYSFFYDSRPGGGTTVAGITLPGGGNQPGYDYGSSISDFNDKGQALAAVTNGSHVAVLDAKTGKETLVDLPANYRARSIDDAGRIYGDLSTPGQFGYRPFIYEDGKVQLLDLPAGTTSAGFVDANNAGQVLAYGTDGSNRQAFLFSNGAWSKLGDFMPTRLNAGGDVLGLGGVGGSEALFLAHGTTSPIDLGNTAFSGSWTWKEAPPYSFGVYDLNDKGDLVGQLAGHDGHGFLYQGGVTTDLNSLIDASSGWVIKEAVSINDLGQIVALTNRGYALLTPDGLPAPPDLALPNLPPVPEPSAYIVFGTLAIAFVWRRSRR